MYEYMSVREPASCTISSISVRGVRMSTPMSFPSAEPRKRRDRELMNITTPARLTLLVTLTLSLSSILSQGECWVSQKRTRRCCPPVPAFN